MGKNDKPVSTSCRGLVEYTALTPTPNKKRPRKSSVVSRLVFKIILQIDEDGVANEKTRL